MKSNNYNFLLYMKNDEWTGGEAAQIERENVRIFKYMLMKYFIILCIGITIGWMANLAR